MTSTAAQIYDFNLAAGQSMVLQVVGGFYKILRATGSLEIRREGGSVLSPLLPGQGEREKFTRLTVRDVSGATNVGQILIAGNSFVDDRIFGEVAVVNGQAVRTKAGLTYQTGSTVVGVAATYAYGQVFNPAGSGFNAFVTEVSFSDPAAIGLFGLRNHNAQLLTLNAGARNKNLALGASGISSYFETNAANLGTSFGPFYNAPAGQTYLLTPTDPFLVPPGYGLGVRNSTLGATLHWGVQFYIEPINT